MIPDVDIWRTAAATLPTSKPRPRADALQAKGDLEGQRVWLRVLKAIDELQKAQPGEAKHQRFGKPSLPRYGATRSACC
jgi:hypothetical protein